MAAVMVSVFVMSAVVMPVLSVTVMVAGRLSDLREFARDKVLHSSVSISGCPRIYSDPGFCQSTLSSRSYASADEGICSRSFEESRKCPVSVSISTYYLFTDDLSIFHIDQFELFCPAEMLEDLSVFICHCNSHHFVSFLYHFTYILL